VRSTQVCGQCHGNFDYQFDVAGMNEWFQNGFHYRPGGDVLADRKLRLQREEQNWSDGLIRVAGREYNALVGSACFEHGQMSCLSCHRAHQRRDDPRPRAEWADDQLDAADGDGTCLQCHAKYGQDVSAHTHHAAGSSGSRCYNCHMPYTTYALLKGVRTHRVANPSVQSSLATGRPNACNQCHLDRTLAWTARWLHDWYGTAEPHLSDDEQQVAASVLWTLKGDAGQRALMAWSLGWSGAQESSGRDWLVPFLAELLCDPYDAVRLIAERSLRTLPGFAGFRGELTESAEGPGRAKDKAVATWREQGPAKGRAAVLLRPDGSLDAATFARLLQQRDLHPMSLIE
jgi:hypothetical protein